MDLILKYFPNLSDLQRTQFAKLKERGLEQQDKRDLA